MRPMLAVLLTVALASAQFSPYPGPARRPAAGGGADVSLDAISSDSNAASTNVTIATPSMTTGSNRVLLVMIGTWTDGTVDPTGVSGAGATWTAVGSAAAGNGTVRGRCYVGIAPTGTGVQNLTITYGSAPTYGVVATVEHRHNADQTAGNYTCTVTTSGNQVLTVPTGGLGTSTQFDTVDTRSISGCTSTVHYSTYDVSLAYQAASCTAASSTFTWSGYGVNSIAIGMAGGKQ